MVIRDQEKTTRKKLVLQFAVITICLLTVYVFAVVCLGMIGKHYQNESVQIEERYEDTFIEDKMEEVDKASSIFLIWHAKNRFDMKLI